MISFQQAASHHSEPTAGLVCNTNATGFLTQTSKVISNTIFLNFQQMNAKQLWAKKALLKQISPIWIKIKIFIRI